MQPLPKYTSPQVTRSVRAETGEAYTKLVNTFTKQGPAEVLTFVQQHQQTYIAVYAGIGWGCAVCTLCVCSHHVYMGVIQCSRTYVPLFTTHTYVYTHIYTHAYALTYTHTPTHTPLHTHTPTHTHPYTHTHLYTQDNNMGLVQQVLAAKQRRSVSVLTRTFLTLPLTNIASAAGLPNAAIAEQYVLR